MFRFKNLNFRCFKTDQFEPDLTIWKSKMVSSCSNWLVRGEYHLNALPVEMLGGWHAKAVLQIKKLVRVQAMITGKDEDEAIRHFFQKLVVLLS